ncbi:hypothetical protein [Paenisporosarcina sp. OV554]|uniref:hypothetical protein n=1 Tax=Paenisporosarcina sp. OV554 TaxID=2135694 RepID=UPI000D3D1B72|nr:hypothetical protein [Paenisporosarcina sp. OV554]PUB12615.1 hypothetical protein C8K15_109114 [Paenisporosarcina sp. OV554]
MIDKNEKYLKSIDNTLSDILKELKRQGRTEPDIKVMVDGKESGLIVASSLKREQSMERMIQQSPRSLFSEYL